MLGIGSQELLAATKLKHQFISNYYSERRLQWLKTSSKTTAARP
jgi:hypothetical protein